MKNRNFILRLYQSKSTVFKIPEIGLLLGETNKDRLKARVSYYFKQGVIKRVRRNFYVKPEYNPFELATKIYTPSYISLETVLTKEGVTFQYYKTIFVLSYLTRTLKIDNHQIQLRKVKNDILTNSKGLIQKDNYFIATKERAFLDALYLYKKYYFDNLDVLDKDKVLDLVEIYKNKVLIKQVKKLLRA